MRHDSDEMKSIGTVQGVEVPNQHCTGRTEMFCSSAWLGGPILLVVVRGSYLGADVHFSWMRVWVCYHCFWLSGDE